MAECPCGCGKELTRSEHRYIAMMDERIDFFQTFEETTSDPSNITAFLDDGRALREGLIGIVHGADARTVDRRELRAWIRYADKVRRKVLRSMRRADLI